MRVGARCRARGGGTCAFVMEPAECGRGEWAATSRRVSERAWLGSRVRAFTGAQRCSASPHTCGGEPSRQSSLTTTCGSSIPPKCKRWRLSGKKSSSSADSSKRRDEHGRQGRRHQTAQRTPQMIRAPMAEKGLAVPARGRTGNGRGSQGIVRIAPSRTWPPGSVTASRCIASCLP